ncbi:TRAP transporter substrate-binding protein [soil metagenome]
MKSLSFQALTMGVATAALLAATPALAQTFRIAVGDGAGGTQHELGKAFIEAIEARSGGEMSGRLFLGGQLGDEQATVNDAAMGTLDMSIVAINNITPFSPSVGVLTLPYVILSLEDAEAITQGPIGGELVEATVRDAGVRIIGWAYSGFRVLTNSSRPVETVDDLQGLVIRVPPNEIMIETYRSWGINPTPLPWTETFTALQMGVVDGQDNPYMTVYAMRFDEVQNHITNLRHVFSIEPLIVSESVYQALSPEQQQIVIEAAGAATDHVAQFLREQEGEIREVLSERGMEITDPADEEREFIELATAGVWPKFYDQIGGVEQLNRVLEALGREQIQ